MIPLLQRFLDKVRIHHVPLILLAGDGGTQIFSGAADVYLLDLCFRLASQLHYDFGVVGGVDLFGAGCGTKQTGHSAKTFFVGDLDVAEGLASRVREHSSLELDATGLSVVCFHYRAAGDADGVQAEIARRIQLGGESFLTTTEVDGRTVLRACFINPLTRDSDIDALVDLVVRTGEAIDGDGRDR